MAVIAASFSPLLLCEEKISRRCLCGKRTLIGGISSASVVALCPPLAAAGENVDFMAEGGSSVMMESRPGWYKELYAWTIDRSMKKYEEEVSFSCLRCSVYVR